MCNLKLLLVPTVLLTVCQRELTVVRQFRSTLLVSSYIDVYGEAAQQKHRGKESVKQVISGRWNDPERFAGHPTFGNTKFHG